MMRIVWLGCKLFSDGPIKDTGNWQFSMAMRLVQSGEIELYNIVHSKSSCMVEKVEYKGIRQIVLPKYRRGDTRLYRYEPPRFRMLVQKMLEDIKPDIVHIWGTESRMASLQYCGNIPCPCVIDIQGLFSSLYYYYYGGLSPWEVVKTSFGFYCLTHRDAGSWMKMRWYKKKGEFEVQMLKSFEHISVQSKWVEEQVCSFIDTKKTRLHHTGIVLREEFYHAAQWQPHEQRDAPVIYTTGTSSPFPYKGLLTLLQAIAIVKRDYPHVQLRLAGEMDVKQAKFFNTEGYRALVAEFIRNNDLTENVRFLGFLTANQIVEELHNADCCVISSYVETYCLAAAESLIVGCPTIISYAAALPELAQDGKEAIFYNSKDYKSLAYRISELYRNHELCHKISDNARAKYLDENHVNRLVANQINIYKNILGGHAS